MSAEKGGGMGYREVQRMEVGALIRRWQAGESERAIARAIGLSRNTVQKYLRSARAAGVERAGPPASSELLGQLAQAS